MSFLRITLDIAIPEDLAGTAILQVTNPATGIRSGGIKIPTPAVTKLQAARTAIQAIKAYASKINAGQPNEEMTVITQLMI
jgi:hypothetical protein